MVLKIGGKCLSIQKIQMIITVQQPRLIQMKIFNKIRVTIKQIYYKSFSFLYQQKQI